MKNNKSIKSTKWHNKILLLIHILQRSVMVLRKSDQGESNINMLYISILEYNNIYINHDN